MIEDIIGKECTKYGTIIVVSDKSFNEATEFYSCLSTWLQRWNEWYLGNVIEKADDCIHLYTRSLTLSGWETAPTDCLINLGNTCETIGLPISVFTSLGRLSKDVTRVQLLNDLGTISKIFLEYSELDCVDNATALELTESLFLTQAIVTLVGLPTYWRTVGILDRPIANSSSFNIEKKTSIPVGVDLECFFIDPLGFVYPSLAKLKEGAAPWGKISDGELWGIHQERHQSGQLA